MLPEKRLARRGASRLADCKWDVCDACDAWDNGFLKLAMRGAAPHATQSPSLTAVRKEKPERQRLLTKPRKAHCRKPKPFALTAMCKAMPESQRLLIIGASNKLAPILEKNRIDN